MHTRRILYRIRVKFVCEGHRVKVKVTGAKKVEISYSCNAKIWSAITPILSNMWCLRTAWGFRVRRIEWRDRHLCHVAGSDHAFACCNTMILEALTYAGSLFSHIQCISMHYGSNSYMVIGSRSRSQEQNCRTSVFPQCKTAIGNNSRSIKPRAVMFAYSTGFSGTADRKVWPPSLSRGQKWPRVTKCTHSRVVGVRLEGNLVYNATAWPSTLTKKNEHNTIVASNTHG